MKSIIVLALMMFIGAAIADPQVNTDQGYCHLPWDTNTDNEHKTQACGPGFDENDDNQTATADIEYEKTYTDQQTMPITQDVELTGAGTATDCTLTNDNGTQYAGQNWTLTAKVKDPAKLANFKAAMGTSDPEFDYNGDGVVNLFDLYLLKQQGNLGRYSIVWNLVCINLPKQ